jgi:hypothetical protein
MPNLSGSSDGSCIRYVLSRSESGCEGGRRSLTPEELEARDEARRLLDDKETYRVLDRFGPRDMTEGTKRDASR